MPAKSNSHPRPTLTTSAGAPAPSNDRALTAGPRGPLLLQDYQLLEKLAHQNRERIPERTVHAKGCGAFGKLAITGNISKYTCARALQPGARSPVLARFSTVAGELGAADAERDVRGFALKLYTEEGNWDIVGNNTPVFFIRDPYKFPDFIHSQKRHPRTNLRSRTAMWDFWSLTPESVHQVTILMSDRGIPQSPIHMNGYGSHTYSLWNNAGERFWVKFHFKTRQGNRYFTDTQAEHVTGKSRDTSQEVLYRTIERGDFPRWTLQIQVMPELEADEVDFNPFDVTRVWPHEDYPLIDVGVLLLDRNPEDHFAQIECAAFSPSNVVPGISWSPDKMLQARIFAYADAQRYRLGAHYDSLPVNAPRSGPHHYHRAGAMNFQVGSRTGDPNAYYAPSSFGGPLATADASEPPLRIRGHTGRFADDGDDYEQAAVLFSRIMSQDERERLFDNIASSMTGVPALIKERQCRLLDRVDPAYGRGVRRAVTEAGEGYDPNEFEAA